MIITHLYIFQKYGKNPKLGNIPKLFWKYSKFCIFETPEWETFQNKTRRSSINWYKR